VLSRSSLCAQLHIDAQTDPALLEVVEVGDGNLNLVYIVSVAGRAVVVKQALPYVRCVGEKWPLTLQRAYFEHAALVEHAKLVGLDRVPEVFLFDPQLALIGGFMT